MNFSLNYQDSLDCLLYLVKVGSPWPLVTDIGTALLTTLSQLDDTFSLMVAQDGGDKAADPILYTEILNCTQLDLLY